MPMYDFICDECKLKQERIVKSDVREIECKAEDCEGIAKRQLCAPRGFDLKGAGFYANDSKTNPDPYKGAGADVYDPNW